MHTTPVATVIAACSVALAGCAPFSRAHDGGATSGTGSRPQLLAPASPIADGSDTVTVLRSGEATFAELRGLIDGAKARVEVEVYEFGRADLAAALVRAQARGATVTVIGDPSESATAATTLQLRAAGIDVADYPVRARMIDHVKLLVVDSTVAVVGGINWGAGSAANHDFDVELHGPAVANVERVFERDLVTCGREQVVPAQVTDPAIIVGATLPGSEVLPMVLATVGSARHTLDVAMYTLTDAAAVDAMEAALGRGVVFASSLTRANGPATRRRRPSVPTASPCGCTRAAAKSCTPRRPSPTATP
jgi:phosphatidylserine/phosphatidylglycerophosphate/cardiolipin synthase-like enzyme